LIEGQADSWDGRHLIGGCASYLHRRFGHEKAFREMGAAFSVQGPKTGTRHDVHVKSSSLTTQRSWFLASARDRRWNMGWVHHVTPDTKEQSRQWKHSGSPCPKKAKVVLSAGKVMASFFWDSRGLLLIDYLPKGQAINGQYYVDLPERLNIAIREKRPHLAKKKIIFHHDKARPHTCALTTAKLAELNYDILPHSPY
jgi:hypothetical protein